MNGQRFYRLAGSGVTISLGTPQQIFDFGHPDAMGLFNVPDMHTSLLQQTNNSYLVWITGNIDTNSGSVAMLSTTDFVHYANAGPGSAALVEAVFTPSCAGSGSCVTNIDADYAGANSVITASNGGDLLMFYEAGNQTRGTNSSSGIEYNVTALARPSDGGVHWARQGAVLAGPDLQPTTTSGTSQPGISEPGLLMVNNYFYMFFQYIPNDPSEPGAPAVIQVARALVSSDGMPGSWWKYYQGAWNEPGLGGQADTIVATGAGSGCTRPVEIWPAFSTYLNRYLLLFLGDTGRFFSNWPNLVTWTTPVNFMSEQMWQHCQPMDWNYVFVTPGNGPGIIGQTGLVLYAHTDAKGLGCPGGFSPHELWVRSFTFTNSP
jgi:hypothetical protein